MRLPLRSATFVTTLILVGLGSSTSARLDAADAPHSAAAPHLEASSAASGVDVTYLLDVSGSMSPSSSTVKEGVLADIAALRHGDRFRVIVFNDRGRYLTPYRGPDDASIEKAQQALEATTPGGLSNLYDGLALAHDGLDPGRESRVILITDAASNTGTVGPRGLQWLMGRIDARVIGLVMVDGRRSSQHELEVAAALTGHRFIELSSIERLSAELRTASSATIELAESALD